MTDKIRDFCTEMIIGFEEAMYKSIRETNPDAIDHLRTKSTNFLMIYRDMYIEYFNSLYNSLIKNPQTHPEHFALSLELKLNYKDLCQILATICISTHFSLDRTIFNIDNENTYISSIVNCIKQILDPIDLSQILPKNSDLSKKLDLLEPGTNIIEIDIKVDE